MTIYAGVAQKLQGGADLFMPGVKLSEDAARADKPGYSWVRHNFGRFARGDLLVIVEEGFWAPVALARWSISSEDLEMRGQEGCAVEILHCVGQIICFGERGDRRH